MPDVPFSERGVSCPPKILFQRCKWPILLILRKKAHLSHKALLTQKNGFRYPDEAETIELSAKTKESYDHLDKDLENGHLDKDFHAAARTEIAKTLQALAYGAEDRATRLKTRESHEYRRYLQQERDKVRNRSFLDAEYELREADTSSEEEARAAGQFRAGDAVFVRDEDGEFEGLFAQVDQIIPAGMMGNETEGYLCTQYDFESFDPEIHGRREGLILTDDLEQEPVQEERLGQSSLLAGERLGHVSELEVSKFGTGAGMHAALVHKANEEGSVARSVLVFEGKRKVAVTLPEGETIELEFSQEEFRDARIIEIEDLLFEKERRAFHLFILGTENRLPPITSLAVLLAKKRYEVEDAELTLSGLDRGEFRSTSAEAGKYLSDGPPHLETPWMQQGRKLRQALNDTTYDAMRAMPASCGAATPGWRCNARFGAWQQRQQRAVLQPFEKFVPHTSANRLLLNADVGLMEGFLLWLSIQNNSRRIARLELLAEKHVGGLSDRRFNWSDRRLTSIEKSVQRRKTRYSETIDEHCLMSKAGLARMVFFKRACESLETVFPRAYLTNQSRFFTRQEEGKRKVTFFEMTFEKDEPAEYLLKLLK
jgi:hypothetical protein